MVPTCKVVQKLYLILFSKYVSLCIAMCLKIHFGFYDNYVNIQIIRYKKHTKKLRSVSNL